MEAEGLIFYFFTDRQWKKKHLALRERRMDGSLEMNEKLNESRNESFSPVLVHQIEDQILFF